MNQVNEYESIQAYAYARRSHLPWVTSGAWFICNQFTITIYKQIFLHIQGCSKRETGSFTIHPPFLIFYLFPSFCKINSFCSLATPPPLFKNQLHIKCIRNCYNMLLSCSKCNHQDQFCSVSQKQSTIVLILLHVWIHYNCIVY